MATSVACAARPSLQACCPSASLDPRAPLSSKGVSLASSKAASSPLKLVSNGSRVSMSSNEKKQAVNVGSTAAAVAMLVAAIVPEFAEAAQPGVSASLKNLLLSVVAGGVVVAAIGSAVAAVSTFDPVQRK